MDDTTLAVALWGVAVIVLGWTWVPALVSGLGGTRYANRGTEDPSALETAAEPDYLFWARQLAARGYQPAGSAWMRLTFYGSDWRFEARVRAFWAADRKTFAFMQKQPRPLDVWWLTTFATCWQDGGLLLTSNGEDQPPDSGDFVVQGMESTDLAAVEELHQNEAARHRAGGRRPDPSGTLDTLLAATDRHARLAARHTGVKLGQSYLLTNGLIHAVLSVPAVYTMGFFHWAVPLVNLTLGLVLGISQHMAKRRAAAMLRDQIPSQPAETT